MPGNQRQQKITLKTIISVYSSPPDSGKRFARFKDSEIAEIATQELSRKYTARAVAQARRRMGIEACTPPAMRGGVRPGAGRPLSRSSKKEYRKHKLTISDYDIVKTCQSAYECVEHSKYDVKTNMYVHYETWKLKKGIKAPGLPRKYIEQISHSKPQ